MYLDTLGTSPGVTTHNRDGETIATGLQQDHLRLRARERNYGAGGGRGGCTGIGGIGGAADRRRRAAVRGREDELGGAPPGRRSLVTAGPLGGAMTIQPMDSPAGGLVSLGQLAAELGETRSEEVARDLVARYRENFRLGRDAGGTWLVDAEGVRHSISPTVSQAIFRVRKVSHPTRRNQRESWLVLCEVSGEPVLSIPPYGWDRYDLERFADAAGWDLDLAGIELDGWDPSGWNGAFPHWMDKPKAYATGAWRESAWASLRQRFLRRSRSGTRS